MYFLDDRPELGLVDPVIVASLALSVLAMAFAIRQRRILRFHPRRGADYHVFRLDLATALLWWGLAQVGTVIGWLLRIEGMRMPIWSYLFLIVGVAIGVIATPTMRKRYDQIGIRIPSIRRSQPITVPTWARPHQSRAVARSRRKTW